MAAENGDYTNERLDRIEIMLNTIAADHVLVQQRHQEFLQHHQEFLQENQLLLRAQVVMQDTMHKLAESQQATDERLHVLITTVDGLIRNPR